MWDGAVTNLNLAHSHMIDENDDNDCDKNI